ncbi:MAG: hypothetical protein N4A31_03280 [Rickettsiales bacterium]|jgi:hypothetical protein|nr:hypothetical protein [Rickettsiales bacterium]
MSISNNSLKVVGPISSAIFYYRMGYELFKQYSANIDKTFDSGQIGDKVDAVHRDFCVPTNKESDENKLINQESVTTRSLNNNAISTKESAASNDVSALPNNYIQQ